MNVNDKLRVANESKQDISEGIEIIKPISNNNVEKGNFNNSESSPLEKLQSNAEVSLKKGEESAKKVKNTNSSIILDSPNDNRSTLIGPSTNLTKSRESINSYSSSESSANWVCCDCEGSYNESNSAVITADSSETCNPGFSGHGSNYESTNNVQEEVIQNVIDYQSSKEEQNIKSLYTPHKKFVQKRKKSQTLPLNNFKSRVSKKCKKFHENLQHPFSFVERKSKRLYHKIKKICQNNKKSTKICNEFTCTADACVVDSHNIREENVIQYQENKNENNLKQSSVSTKSIGIKEISKQKEDRMLKSAQISKKKHWNESLENERITVCTSKKTNSVIKTSKHKRKLKSKTRSVYSRKHISKADNKQTYYKGDEKSEKIRKEINKETLNKSSESSEDCIDCTNACEHASSDSSCYCIEN